MEGGPVSERVDELSAVEERAALKLAPAMECGVPPECFSCLIPDR